MQIGRYERSFDVVTRNNLVQSFRQAKLSNGGVLWTGTRHRKVHLEDGV